MKTYREFIAWQKAMGFVTSVYKLTRIFPKKEIYNNSKEVEALLRGLETKLNSNKKQ